MVTPMRSVIISAAAAGMTLKANTGRAPTARVATEMTTAVVISVATRAVGALPVFAFSVIPAAAALMMTDRIGLTIALSVTFGAVSAALGYYVSWVEQLPTGASMVVVASLFLVPGLVKILRRSSV